MIYRREIDGLRAIAVLPVILFHAGFQTFSGGYIGVDVFFVISGYLITTLIISELEQKQFSILNFYERRARRILPALFIVMFFCLPFSWMWFKPQDMKSFTNSLIATSSFSSNIFFLRTSGYFDTASELKPLLHTWSLSVEEQYYLLFPALLLMTFNLGKRVIFWLLLSLFFTSLVAAHLESSTRPMAAFYLLPTRGWEILLGAFVALYFSGHHIESISKRLREIGSIVGIALIIYSIFSFDKNTPSPSLFTTIPTVGSALIILCTTKDTVVGRLLGSRIIVGTGLISYSAYLWHQPLFAFYREYTSQESRGIIAFLSATSLVLAYFSWRYIEKPLRNRNAFDRKSIFTISILGSSFYIVIGVLGYVTNGYQGRLTDEQVEFLTYFENRYPEWRYFKRENWYAKFRIECDFYDMQRHWAGDTTDERKNIATECYERDKKYANSVFIWGDSHAQHFYYGLKNTLPDTWQILQVASSGCSPSTSFVKDGGNYCDYSNYFAYQTIAETRPDVVIVGQEHGHNIETMDDIISKLQGIGVRRIIFAGPSPHWKRGGLPTLIATRLWGDIPRYTFLGLNTEVWQADKTLKESFNNSPTAQYISLFDYFCGDNGCRVYFGDSVRDGITTYDYGHLSPVSSYHFSLDVLSKAVTKGTLD